MRRRTIHTTTKFLESRNANRVRSFSAGKLYAPRKLSREQLQQIKALYYNDTIAKMVREHVNSKSGNQRKLSFNRIFAKLYAKDFNLTIEGMHKLVSRKTKMARLLWNNLPLVDAEDDAVSIEPSESNITATNSGTTT